MIDVREPDQALARISQPRRQFEKGGVVPNATRQLLVELDDALGDSGPLELGIPPRQWLTAQERLSRAVISLRDDRVEVQVGDAKRGLRDARHAFRLASWSARWRRRFGGTTRALRIQLATPWLLAAVAGAVLEAIFQPGGFHPIYLAVGPLVLTFIWVPLFRDATARLRDAALAREAAKELANGQRALVALRLARRGSGSGVELVIATDQQLIAARRASHERWGVTWSAPYPQIGALSEGKADSRRLTLRTRGGARVLECRRLEGETESDYQARLRKALLTVLERRTAGRSGGERVLLERRTFLLDRIGLSSHHTEARAAPDSSSGVT